MHTPRPQTRRVRVRRRFSAPEFVSIEALSGIALLTAAVAALIWINVAPGSYAEVWNTHLTIGVARFDITETARDWVNDGLMTVFFFVVGLEIKRELVCGELRDPRTASLPVIAAIGGMLVPAGLYSALNAGGAGAEGWGIPMATDVAFAVAVLALFASRIPRSLKLFLLTLAIVDDIGAIIVIAVFYTKDISPAWLVGSIAMIAVILVMRRLDIAYPIAYLLPAFVLWLCVLESGIHATIAGVALGLLTPARPVRGRQVIDDLERRLHPWSSFVIVPLFALANAGVVLDGAAIRHGATSTIAWGVIIGLTVGKPVGIVLASWIGLRARLARLPDGVRPADLLGAGMLAGIGFTVSLFIAGLSFSGAELDEAKIGILAASVLSGTLGSIVLLVRRRPPQ